MAGVPCGLDVTADTVPWAGCGALNAAVVGPATPAPTNASPATPRTALRPETRAKSGNLKMLFKGFFLSGERIASGGESTSTRPAKGVVGTGVSTIPLPP